MKTKRTDISKLNLGIGSTLSLLFLYTTLTAHKWSAYEDIPPYILHEIKQTISVGIVIYSILIFIKALYEKGIPIRSLLIALSIWTVGFYQTSTVLAWTVVAFIVFYDIESSMTGEGKNIILFSAIGGSILVFSLYATNTITAYEMLSLGSATLMFSEILLSPPLQTTPKVWHETSLRFLVKLMDKKVIYLFLPLIPIMFIYEISKGFASGTSFFLWFIDIYIILLIGYLLIFLYTMTHYCPTCGFYMSAGTLLFITAWLYKALLNGHSVVSSGIAILGIALLHIGFGMFAELTTRTVITGTDIMGLGLLILTGRFMLLAGDFINSLISSMPIETLFLMGVSDIVGIGMILSGISSIRESLLEWRDL